MTITTQAVRAAYAGDGTTTTFAVPFQFFGADELLVISKDAYSNSTVLVRGTDYSVTGGLGAAGSVTTTSPPAAGTMLYLVRSTTRTQQAHYAEGGPFPSSTHETALDRLVAETQEAWEAIGRCARAPTGEAAVAPIPPLALRVNKVAMWDANGDWLGGGITPDTVPISTAMIPVVQAVTLPVAMGLLGGAWGLSYSDGLVADKPITVSGAAGTARFFEAATGGVTRWSWGAEQTAEGGSNTGGLFNINRHSDAGGYIDTPFQIQRDTGQINVHALGLVGPTVVYQSASIGNAIPSYSGMALTLTASRAGAWENGLSVQISATSTGNKVAGYFAAEAKAGSQYAWAINPLLLVDSGQTTGAYQAAEFDVANNSGTHFGDGATDIGPNAIFGMQVTGISTNRATAAIAILGNLGDGSAQWNRGIVVSNLSVRLATLQDFTASTISLDIRGSHTYGMDTYLSNITGSAIRLANTHKISARSFDGTTDIELMRLNVGNNLILGYGGGVGYVETQASLLPIADNTYTLGTSGARWASIWAANGTIQTSDPTLKDDIVPLPSCLNLLSAINPISFKWKIGGYEAVEEAETVQVQQTETVSEEQEVIDTSSGKPMLVKKLVTFERPVMAEVAVVDEAGNALATSYIAKDGTEKTVPRTHPMPVMVEKTVIKKVQKPRAGKRTHLGWNAEEVGAALIASGLDCGAYVVAEDGTKHLRPDQLVPVLWKAVQELASKVAALEAAK